MYKAIPGCTGCVAVRDVPAPQRKAVPASKPVALAPVALPRPTQQVIVASCKGGPLARQMAGGGELVKTRRQSRRDHKRQRHLNRRGRRAADIYRSM